MQERKSNKIPPLNLNIKKQAAISPQKRAILREMVAVDMMNSEIFNFNTS